VKAVTAAEVAAFRLACTLPARIVTSRQVKERPIPVLHKTTQACNELRARMRPLVAEGWDAERIAKALKCNRSTVFRHMKHIRGE
jgi:hypothetical protein